MSDEKQASIAQRAFEGIERGVGKTAPVLDRATDWMRTFGSKNPHASKAGLAARMATGAGVGALASDPENRSTGAILGAAAGGLLPTGMSAVRESGRDILNFAKGRTSYLKDEWKSMAPAASELVGTTAATRGGNAVTDTANRLGQSGWTGKGKLTRFLPVGPKGLLTGFTAYSGVPAVQDIMRGEADLSTAGEVAGGVTSGLVGVKRGLLPSLLTYQALSEAGRLATKPLDMAYSAVRGKPWKTDPLAALKPHERVYVESLPADQQAQVIEALKAQQAQTQQQRKK